MKIVYVICLPYERIFNPLHRIESAVPKTAHII